MRLDNLKQVRSLKGLTQKELAQRSGISQPEISRLERGMEATPTDTTVFSSVLDVDPEELAKPVGPVSINVNPAEVEPVMELINAYRQDPSVLAQVREYLRREAGEPLVPKRLGASAGPTSAPDGLSGSPTKGMLWAALHSGV